MNTNQELHFNLSYTRQKPVIKPPASDEGNLYLVAHIQQILVEQNGKKHLSIIFIKKVNNLAGISPPARISN